MASKADLSFLGTGDSIPSEFRNTTSILLSFENENILVDCGEGTQRQFRRAHLNPCKITRILITHWHGDHVLGLPGLLSTLSLSGYNKTLYIYGPKGTKEKMRKMFELFPFYKNYKIDVEEISSGKFYEKEKFYIESEIMEHGVSTLAYSFVLKGGLRIDENKLKRSGLKRGSFLQKLKEGKNITHKGKKFFYKNLTYKTEGKKISFVFDTKMNRKIAPFVKNSDVFICEGTYSGVLKDEAEKRLHMTVSQAAETAKKAKVGKLILTHISSRYSKNMKSILNESKKIFKESYLVKDFDKILV